MIKSLNAIKNLFLTGGGGSGSSSTVENIGFSELKTDRDFEVSAGQWKPIYMKKVDIGAIPNNSTKHVAHNISDLEYIINHKMTGKRSTNERHFPIPYVEFNTSYQISLSITPTTIDITTQYDWSAITESFIILEYTKTIDTATSNPRNT